MDPGRGITTLLIRGAGFKKRDLQEGTVKNETQIATGVRVIFQN
jgi:hypothetical protein